MQTIQHTERAPTTNHYEGREVNKITKTGPFHQKREYLIIDQTQTLNCRNQTRKSSFILLYNYSLPKHILKRCQTINSYIIQNPNKGRQNTA